MLALRQGALRPAVEIIEFIELIQQFLGHFVAFQMTDVQKNLPDSISSPLAGPNRAFKTVQLFLQLRNPRRFFGGRSKVGQLLDNLLKMLVFFAPQRFLCQLCPNIRPHGWVVQSKRERSIRVLFRMGNPPDNHGG